MAKGKAKAKGKAEGGGAPAGARAKGRATRRRAPLVDRVTRLVLLLFLASLAVPHLVRA